ncbi:diiron oxygenase [Rhodococcus sp. JVH1]|uniref:AurF N-oxygenase family protein n=1 Tax=Rhodococcus sp. JVH1 TaxID=745408 RepID=UPI000271FDB4|nr:diiron oxygenase [Rhodococcus sp. JVH1]EJJ00035.1 integral membrane protein [Rhodococcus sp. JVH1]
MARSTLAIRNPKITDRQDTGDRLLQSSARRSYDPTVEVDWDAPVPDDLYGLTPEWSSLYGTPMWDEMTFEQQITLTKHEVSSIMGTGIWFEMILQQMVIRDMYAKDASQAHFQFALTEVADECRHSVMFARTAEKFGCPSYVPRKSVVTLGRGFKALASGEVAYAGILVAEEILDVMQRDWMKDTRVQPIVRVTSKIHVVEEARHMRFAREETLRRAQGMSKAHRAASRACIAIASNLIVSSMINPAVYAAAGLDTERALREAKNNRFRADKIRESSQPLMRFLDDADLLGGPSRHLYKRVNML